MTNENKIFKARHLNNLQKLFKISDVEALKLFNSLRRIECKLNRLYVIYCERQLTSKEEEQIKNLKARATKLLRNIKGLTFNTDPRGYSIKMDDVERKKLQEKKGINLWMDMGGYGIFAPDFN